MAFDPEEDGRAGVIARATSRGLHEMAQPLTVVQGVLEVALAQAESPADFRQAMNTALAELERVTVRLEHVRQVVRLQQPAGDQASLQASEAVRAALQGMENTLAYSGIEVILDQPDDQGDIIEVSAERVQVALGFMLKCAVESLPGGGELRVNVHRHLREVQIRVQALRAESAESLASGSENYVARDLDMAQALAASMNGNLRYSLNPFTGVLTLPRSEITTDEYRSGESKYLKGDPIHV